MPPAFILMVPAFATVAPPLLIPETSNTSLPGVFTTPSTVKPVTLITSPSGSLSLLNRVDVIVMPVSVVFISFCANGGLLPLANIGNTSIERIAVSVAPLTPAPV